MPIYKCDLHIHSVLSPCAEREMTPNNIVNMAAICGTDIIAVSDHNNTGNIKACMEVAPECGVCVVPAIEITTAEDIHLLCLFSNIESAEFIKNAVNDGMPKFDLDKRIYYPQEIMNSEDEVIAEVPYLLTVSTALDIYTLCDMVNNAGGVPIPAHVDKDGNGIIPILGLIPDDLPITTVEASKHCPRELLEVLKQNYTVIRSCDAHRLEALCWEGFRIELDEPTAECLIKTLRKPKNTQTV